MVDKQGSPIPPPPYNDSTQDDASTPPPKQYPPPPDIKPTNFIAISSHRAVRGVWVIDPGFMPPVSLMAYSIGQEERSNVFIESHDGDVDVHIFVLPSPPIGRSKVSIKVTSWSGSACFRVHDAETQGVSCTREPLIIAVKSVAKKAEIYIPRSFKGPLQLFTGRTGKVFYSKAVKAQIVPISSIGGANKCFLGDSSDWKDGGKPWPGDILRVDAKEEINIYYDDEGSIPTKDTSEGGCIMM